METDGFLGPSRRNSDLESQDTGLQQPQRFQFDLPNAASSSNPMQEFAVSVQQNSPLCISPQHHHAGFDAQNPETLALTDSASASSGRMAVEETDMGSVGGVEKNVEDTLGPEAQELHILGYHDGVRDLESKAVERDGLLEAEKKRLLAELELGAIFEGKTLLQSTTEPDGEEVGLNQGFCDPAAQSLQLQAIHDGALIESVPSKEVGSGYLKTREVRDHSVERNSKQECWRKEKRSRRRGKTVNEDSEKTKWNTDMARVAKFPKNEGEPRRAYSRKEMEALRYVKVGDQKKLWKDVYKGLGAEVRQNYDGLASSKRSRNVNLKFDPTASMAVGKNLNKEPQDVEDYETENIDLYNQAGDHIMHVGGELDEDDDSDDDYGSILRPAFQVEGEPDFDSGPPEDGFEYLRRVRWEAAQIPKVKVAKREKSKMSKEQSIYMPQIPEISMCLDHLLPTKDWEDMFLSDFSELRQVLSDVEDQSIGTSTKMAPVFNVWESNNSCQPLEAFISEKINNLTMGEMCVGETTSENGSTAISPSDGNQSGKTRLTQSLGELPSLSDIQRMGAVVRVSMLRKRISSFEEMTALSRCDCAWLFALCAAVDTPLNAHTCASLRSLLRKCAALRAAKSEVDDEVAMLNILATIAGRYFGQSER